MAVRGTFATVIQHALRKRSTRVLRCFMVMHFFFPRQGNKMSKSEKIISQQTEVLLAMGGW